jgi:hypothetical protein
MALGALGGCSTSSETFAGRPSDQVWTAMVTAAEQPAYRDWHVIENDVWADETSGRIEIYRLLRRYKDPPGEWARMEDQTWKFSIQFEPTEPPSAQFAIRSWTIPSHSWGEGDRYFDQVWTLLGGRPTPGMGEPAAQPAAKPTSQPAVQPAATPPPDAAAASPAANDRPQATGEAGSQPKEPPVDLPD